MNIKVCGLREPANITAIAALGVDYIGLIFHVDSPRFVDPALAAWLVEHKASLGEVQLVGVFVNAEVDYVLNTVHDYQLDWVQLHGDESAGYCDELKLLWSVNTLRKAKICKAFSVSDRFDFNETAAYVRSCPLFVFDTGGKKQAGGTGEKWDWKRLEQYTGPVPFLLSGGIGPHDAAAIRALNHKQLSGVDLNSRFETSPGVKDVDLVAKFVSALSA